MSGSGGFSFRATLPGGRVLFDNGESADTPGYQYVELDSRLVYHLYEDTEERSPHVIKRTDEEIDSFLVQPIGTRNQHLMNQRDAIALDTRERRTRKTEGPESCETEPPEGVIWCALVFTDKIGRTLMERHPDLWASNLSSLREVTGGLDEKLLKTALDDNRHSQGAIDPGADRKEELARLERRTERALTSIFGLGQWGMRLVTGRENTVTQQSMDALLSGPPCAERTLTCILLAEERHRKAEQYIEDSRTDIEKNIRPEYHATWKFICARRALDGIGHGLKALAGVFAPGNGDFLPSEAWHRPETWAGRLEVLGRNLLDSLEVWDHELAVHAKAEERVKRFRYLHIASAYLPGEHGTRARSFGPHDPESLIGLVCEAVLVGSPHLNDILPYAAFLIGPVPESSFLPLRLLDAHLERASLRLDNGAAGVSWEERVQNIVAATEYFRQMVQWPPEEQRLFSDRDIVNSGQKIVDAMGTLPTNVQFALAKRLEPYWHEGSDALRDVVTQCALVAEHAAVIDWMENPDNVFVVRPGGTIGVVPEAIRKTVANFMTLRPNPPAPGDG